MTEYLLGPAPPRPYLPMSPLEQVNYGFSVQEPFLPKPKVSLSAVRRKMILLYKRRCVRRIAVGSLIACLLSVLFLFVLLPILFKCSYAFQRNLLFLNFISEPVDFENPAKYGLAGTRNFYISTPDNVTLGVWQVLPASLATTHALSPVINYDALLNHGEPVFIYMHGNSGNRGSGHRVELYKFLAANNYHVIAFDYRSYGDSSNVEPSETGLVSDSVAVYYWTRQRVTHSKIYLWGHSLGTGVSSHALDRLEREGQHVAGLVLESPFNNIANEIQAHPMAKLFRFLPWFDYFFTEPMYENGLRFESDRHLQSVKTPILIVHAEDDLVIPYSLGQKLYQTLVSHRHSNDTVSFVKVDRSKRLGHKFIVRDVSLPSVVR